MFCIPYPPDSDGVIPPIEVPYVAQYTYDVSIPNLFANFAHECRFDSYNERHPDELASLMQSWLFFGLLAEILGRNLDHLTIVRSRSNCSGQDTQFIDTRLDQVIHDLVTDRFVSLEALPGDQAVYISSKIKERIDLAAKKALDFEKVCSY